MITIPKSRELIFKVNPDRHGIYDLSGSQFHGFTFIRLSEPRSDFLIRQGARFVIESWDHGQKPLFSGLRPITNGFYYGDRFTNGKRSLMIVKINPDELKLYLFKTYPRMRRLNNILSHFRTIQG
jgi:hypothetical protein